MRTQTAKRGSNVHAKMLLARRRVWRGWVLLPAIALACGPSERSAQRAPAPVGTETAALSGSTTLADALRGRVNPVPAIGPGGFIAAGMNGEAEVQHNGSAAYQVPLWTPDGVAGLKPSLSLTYNSHASRGLLGPRWQLAGLSAITRCRQTLAQDDVQRPIDVENGDTFCLDGERLVRTTGTAKWTGEFRTEVNPFQKIVASGNGLTITSFKVFQPDGRIFYYGSGTGRLSAYPPLPAEYFHTFYVDKIEDRYGNTLHITYRTPDHSYGYGSRKAQERVPDRITWGGVGAAVGQRSVKFFYEPVGAYDPEQTQRYVDGYQVVAGPLLTGLEMHGPDGAGGVALLKKYTFTYTRPTITGEKLLESFSECDPNDVCKRPTKLTWEVGSRSYKREAATSGGQPIADVYIGADLPDVAGPGGYTYSLANVYRRLLVVDLNNDGRDDIVYRQLVPSSSSPTGTRLGWKARFNTTVNSNVSFAAPMFVPGAELVDPTIGTESAKNAYHGDLIFHDLNLDDYPDYFVPVASSNRTIRAYQYAEAYCPVPGGLTSCHGWHGPSALDDPTKVAADSSWLSVGDVTGDGFPELLRPAVGNRQVHWRSFLPSADGVVSGLSAEMRAFQILDLDGDGTSEVAMDTYPGTGPDGGPPYLYRARVSSPTMSGEYPDMVPLYRLGPVRLLLDLNGDGLVDIVSAEPGRPHAIQTHISAGDGKFIKRDVTDLPTAFNLGQAWVASSESLRREHGIRVTDFNLDGRQDLLLVDNGHVDGAGPSRGTVKVLLSDGAGGFLYEDTYIPVGDFADGLPVAYDYTCNFANATPCEGAPASKHGYRTTAIADVNGDGLPDVLQLDGGQLVAHVRQGNKPDVVNAITEGTGRKIELVYAPASDSATYTPDVHACYGADSKRRLTCLTRARWLTKQLTVSGWETPNVTSSQTTRFTYHGGLFDRFGRGFLGFKRREIHGPNSRRTTITYNPTKTLDWSNGGRPYIYPWAFRPETITTDIDTPHGPNAHHREVQTFTYSAETLVNASRFRVLPLTVSTRTYDCVSNGAGGCAGTLRLLGGRDETLQYYEVYAEDSQLGKPIKRTFAYLGGDGSPIRVDVTVAEWTPPAAAHAARCSSRGRAS